MKCTGCRRCADNWPSLVFDLQELPDHQDSKKSRPVRLDECVLCMTCETLSPTGAIRVEE